MKLYFDGRKRWIGDFELSDPDESMRGFVKDFVRYNEEKHLAEIYKFMSLMRLQAGLNEQDECVFELTIPSSMDETKELTNELEQKRYRKTACLR